MKTLKFLSISTFLLLTILCAISFVPVKSQIDSNNTKKRTATRQWYVYQYGYPSNFSLSIMQNNYRPLALGEDVNSLCDGYLNICAIYADPDPVYPNKPYIVPGTTIFSRLNEFFSFGVHNPNFIRLKGIDE